MSDYSKLAVWRKAHALTIELYSTTGSFPKSEMFGITSQIRRAASSIGANLAEGCGRRGDGDLHRYIRIAMGSCNELDYHLLLARDLGFFDTKTAARLRSANDEVGRMLTGLLERVELRIRGRKSSVCT